VEHPPVADGGDGLQIYCISNREQQRSGVLQSGGWTVGYQPLSARKRTHKDNTKRRGKVGHQEADERLMLKCIFMEHDTRKWTVLKWPTDL
jgi:hypothetical protein